LKSRPECRSAHCRAARSPKPIWHGSKLTVAASDALAEAERLDRAIAAGDDVGPLAGVPLAIKDAIDTEGLRTTGGLKLLKDWVPPKDAPVVAKLRNAGALTLGKTNMHEMGYGITSYNPHYGPVRNPYADNRIPGGSSGGSGAAVAAGLCGAALGADTGGSVRIPAALSGCVGFKPSPGRLDSEGVMCLSTTTDVVGPLARTVADAAVLYQIMGGEVEVPASDTALLKGLRIGLPVGHLGGPNDQAVDAIMAAVQTSLACNGVEFLPIALPHADQAVPTGFTLVVPETIYLTERYWRQVDPALTIAGALDQMGDDLRGIMAGEVGPEAQPIPAQAYVAAFESGRKAVIADFEAAFEAADLLLLPTTPLPAVTFDEREELNFQGEMAPTFPTFVRNTFGISVAGLPAISLPGGQTESGLPMGIQLVAPWGAEQRLFDAADAWQTITSGT
jgi:Asp-tRNA(Asn)/Glu-tRNA(Gln) amidotransferase A subunit family amidase